MSLKIQTTTKFEKDLKRIKNRGKDTAKLKIVIILLCETKKNLKEQALMLIYLIKNCYAIFKS